MKKMYFLVCAILCVFTLNAQSWGWGHEKLENGGVSNSMYSGAALSNGFCDYDYDKYGKLVKFKTYWVRYDFDNDDAPPTIQCYELKISYDINQPNLVFCEFQNLEAILEHEDDPWYRVYVGFNKIGTPQMIKLDLITNNVTYIRVNGDITVPRENCVNPLPSIEWYVFDPNNFIGPHDEKYEGYYPSAMKNK